MWVPGLLSHPARALSSSSRSSLNPPKVTANVLNSADVGGVGLTHLNPLLKKKKYKNENKGSIPMMACKGEEDKKNKRTDLATDGCWMSSAADADGRQEGGGSSSRGRARAHTLYIHTNTHVRADSRGEALP